MPPAPPIDFKSFDYRGQTVRYRTKHILIKVNTQSDDPQEVPTVINAVLSDALHHDNYQIVNKPLGRWAYLRIDGPSPDIPSLAKILKDDDRVQFAEPDLILEGSIDASYPSDPLLQEGSDPQQWGLKYIHLDEVWKTQRGNESILIGIVDSGIPLKGNEGDTPGLGMPLGTDEDEAEDDLVDHVDFKGSRFLAGNNYVKFEPPLPWPHDDHLDFHGTYMAGIIAAWENNQDDAGNFLGTAGVNWGSNVYVCTALDSNDLATVGYACHAVDEILSYADVNGIPGVVINLSINQDNDVKLETWKEMLLSVKNAGAILCISAGNIIQLSSADPVSVYEPAKTAAEDPYSPHVIVVGAMGIEEGTNKVILYERTGLAFEEMVFAPGIKIATTDGGNGWTWDSGTSIANAHVSGLAALLWSEDNNLLATEIVKCIKNTCVQPTEMVDESEKEKLNASYGIVDALAAYQAIRGSAENLTPSIVFDDVAPDLDHQQEIQIQVTSCGETTFQVEVDGHDFGISPGTYSHDPCSPNPFTLIATYSASAGDTETGTVTITWNQRPDFRWEIQITAQRAVRRTSIYLVLDKSGSMASSSGIGSYTRLEVLKYSAGVLVDKFPAGDGLGAVSFNSVAADLAEYILMDPGDLTGSRTTVETALDTLEAGGLTSIAAGILAARDHLDALPAGDAKAMIVLTDGRQTHEPWLNDLLAEEVGYPVYAIGMGNASTIQPADLIEVTGSTDGYTVLTGNLDDDTEHLVGEFLSQILGEILDDGVLNDPTQHILPGAVHRFPILLSEADKNVEVILLRPPEAPLELKVFDPDDQRLDPGRIEESDSDRLVRRTFEGPHAHGRPGSRANGIWHVEVSVPPDDFSTWIKNMEHRGVDTDRLRLHGPAYTFRAHARTNLKMKCRISQSGYSPGSTLFAHVKLADRGRPLDTMPTVTALMTDPWGNTRTLRLRHGQSGLWEASAEAPFPGIYTWVITAEGRTPAGHAFRRQCKLTGAVWTPVTTGPPGQPGPPIATPS